MFRIIYFELRKNFLRKGVMILFGVFFLMNIINIFYTYRFGMEDRDMAVTPYNITSSCYKYYESLHQKYDGNITRDKISEINDKYESMASVVEEGTYSREYDETKETGYLYGDFYYLGKYIYSPMKYFAMYSKNMDHYLEKVWENKMFYAKVGNQAEKEKYTYLERVYKDRKISSFYEVENWSFLFHYKFSDLMVIILILLGAIPMFEQEKTTGMYDIIFSNYKGKKSYFVHKFIALILYTITVSVLFMAANYVVIKQLFQLKGAFRPLYCIPEYQFTNVNFSLFGFYMWNSSIRLFGFMVIAFIIGKLSQVSKGIVSSYIWNLGFLAVGLYCSGFCTSELEVEQWLGVLSPFSLLKGDRMYDGVYDFFLGNHYFVRGHFCLIIQIAVFIVLLGCSVYQGMQKRKVNRSC